MSSDQNGHFLRDPDRLEHEQQIPKDERGTNIRDLDAPEIMKIKQVQSSNQFQLKPSVETQGRNLKKTLMNIGNQS